MCRSGHKVGSISRQRDKTKREIVYYRNAFIQTRLQLFFDTIETNAWAVLKETGSPFY